MNWKWKCLCYSVFLRHINVFIDLIVKLKNGNKKKWYTYVYYYVLISKIQWPYPSYYNIIIIFSSLEKYPYCYFNDTIYRRKWKKYTKIIDFHRWTWMTSFWFRFYYLFDGIILIHYNALTSLNKRYRACYMLHFEKHSHIFAIKCSSLLTI